MPAPLAEVPLEGGGGSSGSLARALEASDVPATNGAPPTKRKKVSSQAAEPNDADQGEQEPQEVGRRARQAREDLLRDAIIGYVDDGGDDPGQSGVTAPRQSKEIKVLTGTLSEVPIAKDRRAGFVWVAAAKGLRRKYTWNVDEMDPLPKFEQAVDNTCDICGASCSEVLYEFRCYRRLRRGKDKDAIGSDRRLHPFVSYISKECGRGLLGAQSELSRLRERLYRLVSEDGEVAIEALRELWKVANKPQRRLIQEELRHFAKSQAGESQKAVELRAAESLHGPLHRFHEDTFRAVARALAPGLTARELASVAIQRALDHERRVPPDGFFGKLVTCLQERQPLPTAPAPWAKGDVEKSLKLLTRAWPMRVELFDSLGRQDTFEPKNREAMFSVQLVYLSGCGELHALSREKVEAEKVQAVRDGLSEMLQRSRVTFSRSGAPVGQHKPVIKAQDRAIDVPLPASEVSPEYVRQVLEGITWPACFSRNNVKPDDVPFIQAFPLGMVNNYCLGLCCSRTLKLWPNLTMLLTRFLAHNHPSFRYTTIQLNRDYAAKMHVDGNNHGPSYIIGFGDYKGGELWMMDKDGDVEMEVTESLRGFPQFKVGEKVKGSLVNINKHWVKFDGNLPHQAMPFKGHRISIVYFSRKGFIRMSPDVHSSLHELGFLVPGEETLGDCTVRAEAAAAQRLAAPAAAPGEELEEDEVDEDEKVDAHMREEEESAVWPARDWAATFRSRLGIKGVRESRALGLFISGMSSGSPCLALAQLLDDRPEDRRCRVLAISGVDAPAVRFAKRNLRADHLSTGSFGAEAGPRSVAHCEVHHRACETPAAAEEDLFVAAFSCAPFLNRDAARNRHTCFDDPRALAFWRQRRHVEVRRPRVAVFEVADFEEAPLATRPGVLAFLLDGVDQRAGTHWGLRSVPGYGLALVDLWLADFGLPRAESRGHVVLVREDCGGQHAAETIAGLVRVLGGVLPACTIQHLAFEEDDPRLLEVRRGYQQQAAAVTAGPPVPTKALADEGLLQHFPHCSPQQRERLALAMERAREGGLDLEGLVVDLGQDPRQQPWRDDGLLPALAPGSEGLRYSLAQRRPLTGHEELLCHGFPIWQLNLQGLTDEQCLHLAAGGMPVPVIGATLCAALAVVDWGPGRWARPDPAHVAELLRTAPPAKGAMVEAQGRLTAATATAAPEATEADAKEAQFEGRAAALLSIVSHGGFGRGDDAEVGKTEAKKAGEAVHMLITSLGRVSGGGAVDASGDGQDSAAAEQAAEPKDWPTRERKLRLGTDKVSWDAAARWIQEASEDPEAPLARELIASGLARLRKQLESDAPEEALRHAASTDILGYLRAAGRKEEAKEFDGVLRTAKFLHTLSSGDARLKFGMQTPETVPRYIAQVVRGCDRNSWPMRRGFLDHLAQELTGSGLQSGSPLLLEFGRLGGWEPLATWLREAPPNVKSTWPSGGAVLQALSAVVPGKCLALHLAMADVDRRPGEWAAPSKVAQRIDVAFADAVASAFVMPVELGGETLRTSIEAARASLKELGESDSAAAGRFKRIAAVLDSLAQADAYFQNCKADRPATDWLNIRREFDEGLAKLPPVEAQALETAGSALAKVSALEEALCTAVRSRLDDQVGLAGKQCEAKVLQAKAAEEQKHCSKAQAAATALAPLLLKSRLKNNTPEGFNELLTALQDLVAAHAACQSPPMVVQKALDAGQLAARRYSEAPIRSQRARAWLKAAGMQHCIPLLNSHGLLDRVHDIGKTPELADACGLPFPYRDALVEAVSENRLSESQVVPLGGASAAPPGWERRLSRRVGVYYYQAKTAAAAAAIKGGGAAAEGEQTLWQWPLTASEEVGDEEVAEDPLVALDLPTPEAPGGCATAAPPELSRAAYVDFTPFGDVFCGMCSRTGRRHLRSSRHSHAVAFWAALTELLVGICAKLRAHVAPCLPLGHEEGKDKAGGNTGLVLAWRGALQKVLRAAPVPCAVKGTFWNRVILPHLPESGELANSSAGPAAAALGLLTTMVAAASATEPEPRPTDGAGVKATLQEAELQQKAENTARQLLGKLDSEGCLRRELAEGGLHELLGLIQELRSTLNECGQKPGAARDSLAAGENAVRLFCERKVRQMQASEWLGKHSLQHCCELLKARGLLERIPEVAATPNLAERAGLPKRCREALTNAAFAGKLTDIHFAPRAVPPGWGRAFSRSVGLEYFIEVGTSQVQWEWPVPSKSELPDALVEPPDPVRPTVAAPMDGAPPYLELDLVCEPFCLLCGAAGSKHLKTAEHSTRREQWAARLQHLEAIISEIRRVPSTEAGRSALVPALAKAWHGELLQTVAGVVEGNGEAALSNEVSRAMWHCVARPQLLLLPPPETLGGASAWAVEMTGAIEAMIAVARTPEPTSFGDGF